MQESSCRIYAQLQAVGSSWEGDMLMKQSMPINIVGNIHCTLYQPFGLAVLGVLLQLMLEAGEIITSQR